MSASSCKDDLWITCKMGTSACPARCDSWLFRFIQSLDSKPKQDNQAASMPGASLEVCRVPGGNFLKTCLWYRVVMAMEGTAQAAMEGTAQEATGTMGRRGTIITITMNTTDTTTKALPLAAGWLDPSPYSPVGDRLAMSCSRCKPFSICKYVQVVFPTARECIALLF